MKHLPQSSYLLVVASLLLALVLAGCGGGASSATAIPTNTQIPTYNFVQPTATLPRETATPTGAAESTAESTNEAASTSEAAATSEATTVASASTPSAAAALDPEVVARGKGRYDALTCATCHGENGEGTDKGSSLIASTQTEDEFISFMRSGGKLGSSHQYATNRLSQTGGEALYQYLLSLRKS